MPVVVGRRPESKLVRDGLHSGAWQWALVKSMPRRARRSMFGVKAWGWPSKQPIQSFRSSMAMKSTLGRDPAARQAGARRTNHVRESQHMRIGRVGFILIA